MRRKRALKLLHRDGGDELVEQLGALLLDCELRLALAREKINLGSLTKKFLTIYHEQLKKRAPSTFVAPDRELDLVFSKHGSKKLTHRPIILHYLQ